MALTKSDIKAIENYRFIKRVVKHNCDRTPEDDEDDEIEDEGEEV